MDKGKHRFSNAQFMAAIKGSGGLYATIAKRVGCDWHTAKKRVNESPALKQALDDECETILDIAESKCIELVTGGDPGMIRFFLATKGKERGYSERREVTGADGGPVGIQVLEVVKDYGAPN